MNIRFSFLCLIFGAYLITGCQAPKVREGAYEPFEGTPPKKNYHVTGGPRSQKRQDPFQLEAGEYIKISHVAEGDKTEAEAIGEAGEFEPEHVSSAQSFASTDKIRSFSESSQIKYKMGPGDIFSFLVRGRDDISREDIVVAPDGLVSLPRVGVFNIEGMTIPEATNYAVEKLSKFYDNPDVSLQLSFVNNNQVYVLGRVANPGAVHFTGQGTLLEALSLAGGLPADTRLSFLSRCMIVRGNEMLIWIDLRELLEKGNLALNTKLQNGDFIFIPQSEDQLAYVMGEVERPGVLVLRSQMTILDAVMRSGGITMSAEPENIFLVRSVDGKGYVTQINLNDMISKADMRENFILRDGDIVYAAPSKLGSFNTFLIQLLPSMKAIDFSIDTAESFGAMAELRNRLWGQEGFINGSN
ncbi:SLBB domain-containing protein [Kiritimatiellaeota bacterium B1221]|nr:SLBB domain-containing protein [Kiritimatiellaeota bacterium B1221]